MKVQTGNIFGENMYESNQINIKKQVSKNNYVYYK